MRHIVIIEDETDIAELLACRFGSEGFRVATASDGRAGLHAVHLSRPHLIILDLLLPTMNGWEICRRLKRSPDMENVKVVLLTLKGEAAYRAGADGYLIKGGQVEPTLPPIRVFRHPPQGILGDFLHRRAVAA